MMRKELCPECGRILVANQYGILLCPICQRNEKRQYDMMEESTGGGYY